MLSSTGCGDPVINPLLGCTVSGATPFSPGWRNEFHVGLQQALGRYLVFSGEYVWKYTHNAYDFGVFGSTPLTFPIEWHNSKIPGVDIVAQCAVWSPDGHQIAFAKGSEIYVAKADGSNVRKLITLSGNATDMRFSPDGTHLRFSLWSPPNQLASIWEARSDGADLHPLLPGWHISSLQIAGAWSPDGGYYFFTSATPPDSNDASIWAIREAGRFFQRRASLPMQLTTGPMAVFFGAISPDGKKLFAGGHSTRTELVRYDARSRQFVPFLGGISAGELDFSRDGKWVAYVRDGILWRSRVDGSEVLQLTSPAVHAFLPRWSPDGAQIAYVDEHAGPFWSIFLISAQGGTPQEMLSENENQLGPDWSPDGKQIVFGRVPWLKGSQRKSKFRFWISIPGRFQQFQARRGCSLPDGLRMANTWPPSRRMARNSCSSTSRQENGQIGFMKPGSSAFLLGRGTEGTPITTILLREVQAIAVSKSGRPVLNSSST